MPFYLWSAETAVEGHWEDSEGYSRPLDRREDFHYWSSFPGRVNVLRKEFLEKVLWNEILEETSAVLMRSISSWDLRSYAESEVDFAFSVV